MFDEAKNRRGRFFPIAGSSLAWLFIMEAQGKHGAMKHHWSEAQRRQFPPALCARQRQLTSPGGRYHPLPGGLVPGQRSMSV